MNWREFFDGDHAIYVSERHKLLHARIIERGILARVPGPEAHVLDFGCGEALHGDAVAKACGRLWLCDTSPKLRAELTARFVNHPHVTAIAPEMIELGVPDGSLDLVVTVSVLQYMSREEFAQALALWMAKLKPGGTVVVADVIPPDVSMADDTEALLSFAWKGGFLFAALAGLVKTALSDYRKIREKLGLTTYTAAELDTALHTAGFAAIRRVENIGHNQARMTFVAEKPQG
jgi:SAM-dependent methyltransferase